MNAALSAIASEIIDLQDRLNQRIDKQWTQAGFAWHRAVWMECAELVEHLPWKWWKAGGDLNVEQLRLEAIDILHFMVSWMLVECADRELAHADIVRCLEEIGSSDGVVADAPAIIAAAEACAAMAAGREPYEALTSFGELCAALGLTPDVMRQMYVGKNALNTVRNQLGYKAGTYVKTWAGEEDNVHLERLMAAEPTLGFDALIERLVATYRAVVS